MGTAILLLDIRGWGRLKYMQSGAVIGYFVADAINVKEKTINVDIQRSDRDLQDVC